MVSLLIITYLGDDGAFVDENIVFWTWRVLSPRHARGEQ